ncbi:MAG: ABC transporter permease, partial [Anaerolineae bacterium]
MSIVERRGRTTIITVAESVPLKERPRLLLDEIRCRLLELWQYRELVKNLATRDLKVRYKNSVLGVLWSLLNPLFMMVVFTVVFTVMRNEQIGSFPMFVLIGLLPWQFFSNSVMSATSSIVGNANLINKVYFPREVLPLSAVLSNLVNFLLALLVLWPIMFIFDIPLTGWALLLPVVIATQIIFTLGVSLLTATANVFYRDTQIILEVLLLAWFFLTPIFYSIEILPKSYELWNGVYIDIHRWSRILNPMASLVETYRVILYGANGSGGAPPALDFLLRTIVTSVGILGLGTFFFYRYNARFGEEV